MARADVVRIFTQDGEVVEYRLLSARIPEFRERYPVELGYRVEVDAVDAVSAKAGLLRLYEKSVEAGRKPEDVGLPPISAPETMLFRAVLRDADGKVLETASALKPIQSYKDWESGETAARQRLLAALGFGGDVFDRDEQSDIRDQGIEVAARGAPARQTAGPDTQGAVAAPSGAEAMPEMPARSESAASAEGRVPPALARQIEHQARLRNVAVPAYGSVTEAKAALRSLLG